MTLNARTTVSTDAAHRRAPADGQRAESSRYSPRIASVTMPANGRYMRRSAATIFGTGTTRVGPRSNTTAAATNRTAGRRQTRTIVAATRMVTAANQRLAAGTRARHLG